MHKLILYNYFRSSASFRVRIALNLKKLDFEYKAVNLLKGEQHQAEYRKVNPMGEVPCLQHGDKFIAQSLAIMEYLDKLWPQNELFSKDPLQNAYIKQLCENVNASIQPLQNLKVLKYVREDLKQGEEGAQKWAQHWIKDGFANLEKMLATHSGPYAAGAHITAADLCLVPQCVTAERFKVDLNDYPHIQKVYKLCMEHEAFSKAHPGRQPDTPEELRI